MAKGELIMVLTSPREDGLDYLPGTVEALQRAGAKDVPRMIYSDGIRGRVEGARLDDESFPGWNTHTDDRGPSGSLLGTWRAFAFFLERTNYENLLFFEDDVRPCLGLIEKMIRVGVPSPNAFVSYFDNNDFVMGLGEKPITFTTGFHRFGGHGRKENGFWHTQAMTICRGFIAWALENLSIEKIMTEPEGLFNSDIELGNLMVKPGCPFATYLRHHPSLVEHIGDVSRLGYTTVRRAASFVGEDFDAALTLP